MLIGITGNIGSGKSRVAARLGNLLGAKSVLNGDKICRELMEPGQEGYQRFVKNEGAKYLNTDDGSLDRQKLRRDVFSDEDLKKVLESILHPLVRKLILEEKKRCLADEILIAEIPLLFESGWENDFDFVVAVCAKVEQMVGRVVERDNCNEIDVMAILRSQMVQDEKCQKANFVINNSGDWEKAEEQITSLIEVVRGGGFLELD